MSSCIQKLFLSVSYVVFSFTYYLKKVKDVTVYYILNNCSADILDILICPYSNKHKIHIINAYLDTPDNNITSKLRFCIRQYFDYEYDSLSFDTLCIHNKSLYKKIVIEYIKDKVIKKIELEISSIPFNEINF